MYKNLVKRSKFQKIIVSKLTPVEMLIEGDEVYIYVIEPDNGENAYFVTVQRQSDAGWLELFPGNNLDELCPSIAADGKRWALGGRAGSPFSSEANQLTPTDDNLLVGFSEYVHFLTPNTPPAASVQVVIESVIYEKRT